MADKTNIEWTEATWNPITGCSIDSLGCNNCYAAELAGTRLKHHWSREGLTHKAANGVYAFNGKVRFNEQWLDQPLRWKKPRMIFVCAHGDLFHESVPDEWIDRVFAVMALSPQHTFQLLTKRAERMRNYMTTFRRTQLIGEQAMGTSLPNWNASEMVGMGRKNPCVSPWPLPNLWPGVSAEDQQRADKRIHVLLDTPAAVRWVSVEPMISLVEVWKWLGTRFECSDCGYDHREHGTGLHGNERYCGICAGDCGRNVNLAKKGRGLDWVVVGGESGRRARPCRVEWIRSIVQECTNARVPVFVKQLGGNVVESGPGIFPASIVQLKDRKGGDPSEWPDDLRVRQWPEAVA